MLKVGNKVVVTGGEHSGQKGIITGKDNIAVPGEPQVPVWVVKLPKGKYKFHVEQLKLTE